MQRLPRADGDALRGAGGNPAAPVVPPFRPLRAVVPGRLRDRRAGRVRTAVLRDHRRMGRAVRASQERRPADTRFPAPGIHCRVPPRGRGTFATLRAGVDRCPGVQALDGRLSPRREVTPGTRAAAGRGRQPVALPVSAPPDPDRTQDRQGAGGGSLLFELHRRAQRWSLSPREDEIPLPLTQEHIGDALGLTNVHVNRMLRELREDGVLVLKNGMLRLLDPGRPGRRLRATKSTVSCGIPRRRRRLCANTDRRTALT